MCTKGRFFGVKIIDSRNLTDIKRTNVMKILLLLLLFGPPRFLASEIANLSIQHDRSKLSVTDTN